MAITNLHAFLQDYFRAHHCELLKIEDGMFTIQLTEDMDRALMNRPFYWHYVKKTGHEGMPMQLTLISNPDKRGEKGEWVHFGSPRLQQILEHLKQQEKHTKLFQKVQTSANTPLYPWLVINIKISYTGKQKRDEIFSIGLHLVNGMMKLEMMEKLKQLPLQMKISDYCYTISPMIKLNSGYLRIQSVIDNYIENQTHEWADQSIIELEEEIEMLHYFYAQESNKEQIDKELNEIKERYEPSITYKIINGGIFYLTANALDEPKA
ncbi:YqhG family protein [Virgibacillus ainsalahensis]